MHLNIPPVVPYVFGAILVIFGILRAKYLGAPGSKLEEDDTSSEPATKRRPAQRRHLRWGIIYVLMGLFLLISTYVQTHRR